MNGIIQWNSGDMIIMTIFTEDNKEFKEHSYKTLKTFKTESFDASKSKILNES
jgi:hypothetical protein